MEYIYIYTMGYNTTDVMYEHDLNQEVLIDVQRP